LFVSRVRNSKERVAMRYKRAGTWRTLRWADWDSQAREVAAGLISLGVEPGDRVALLANSRPEWYIADVAIAMTGAASVPIYQSNLPDQCAYILTDSGTKVIFAENPVQIAKLFAPELPDPPGLGLHIIYMDQHGRPEKASADTPESSIAEVVPESARERVHSFDALCERGRTLLAERKDLLESRFAAISPTTTFTIVYTSGTTGPPKGVVLAHEAILSECAGVEQALDLTPDDEQLLFLPLAHIFARVLEWVTVSRGATTAFSSIATIKSDLVEVRPTIMGAVPRVYEKLYAGVQSNIASSPPLKQKIARWATAVGAEVSREVQAGRPIGTLLAAKRAVADRLVFSKLRERLGLTRVRFLVSGGAPLAREMAEFFHSLGVLILEGYGLTETTAASCVNRPERYRFGTVGPAVPGVEVKIAPDGEICIRGRMILREYYKKPDATAEAIDAEGWFHTGDIGVLEDGFLRITDRKKDIIVTAGGKNVAPQNIEGALKARSPYISQVMVHGDKRNFLSALVTLSDDLVAKWAREQGIAFGDAADLASKPEVRKLIQDAFDAVNRELPSYETIKKFAILSHDFTQEAGELTPTLKVKRKFVSEKFKAVLDGFYGN
jgi:long-chain acyl-CoA synthetase